MLVQERSEVRGAPRADESRPPRAPIEAITRHRVLIAIVVLGAIVRVATLTSQSYWLDEAQAAHEVSLSLGAMLSAWSRAEWNPPLYLIVAWPWAHVFGAGEAGLRSLSALFGIALIPVLYGAGAELVSRRAGLYAAAFAALNPFMIWYSQEAREYMLLTLLCAGTLWCFARTWRTGSSRALAWWAAIAALALLTQYFAGFLIAPEGVLLIWRLRSRWSVAALGLQGVVLLAFVPHVTPQLGSNAQFITSQPLWLRIEQVPTTFALSTLAQSSAVHFGLAGGAVAAALAAGLLLAFGGGREISGAVLAAALAAIVIVLPLALALAGQDDFIARGLMPGWPPLAVAFGAACGVRAAPVLGGALAALLLGLFVWAGIRIDADSDFQRPAWRSVAAALGSSSGRGRAVVAYPGQFATGPLSLLLPRVPWSGPGATVPAAATPATISELDVVANAGVTVRRPPASARLIARRRVDGYEVLRYRLSAPWRADVAQISGLAATLVADVPPGPSVMIQPPPSLR